MLKTPSKPKTAAQTATAAKLGLSTAILLVVANMIGSGIFTTTGFLAAGINSEPVLLFSWVVGGILALCGALSYGELASRIPKSGGEYQYLSEIYHPALGFMSGFVSLIVGFSAPIAGAALVFGEYFINLAGGDSEGSGRQVVAGVLVVALTALHAFNVKKGAAVQNVFTVLKVALLLVFIVAGLFFAPDTRDINILPSGEDWDLIATAGFGVTLALVFFAFSGWNAAAYMTGEIKNPTRNVPLALFVGTLLVAVMYIIINYVFLNVSGPAEIAGKGDFAGIVANQIFGDTGGKIMQGLIAFALISSASSMVMAGPRVYHAIGQDFKFFKALSHKSAGGGPWVALAVQLVVTLGMVAYGNVMVIFTYIGLTLSIFSVLTVLAVFIKRFQDGKPSGYKVPLYPLTPLLFLLLGLWLIVFSVYDFQNNEIKGDVPLISAATLAVGFVIYLLTKQQGERANADPLDDNANH